MPTEITQVTDPELGTIFRVKGDMLKDDAELIDRIARASQIEDGGLVTIDLADLDLMDSDSASVLLQLQSEPGFQIIGTEVFLQSIVNEAERRNKF